MTLPSIDELLLHRDTMLLLDRVLSFDDQTAVCEFTPKKNTWYAKQESAMPAWFGIELMAQSIAAHVALLSRRAGLPPKPGALLGTRNYQAKLSAFPVEQPLSIKVTQTYRDDDGLAAYDCDILNSLGKTIGSATLTVFEPENFEEFIAGASK